MDPLADPMDIDESADLEFVADDFEEGEHEKMDKDVLTPGAPPYILLAIVQQSGDRLLKKYESVIECKTLLDNHPSIKKLILEGPKDGYKKLRLLKLLRPEPVSQEKDAKHLPAPPVSSWTYPYVGDAANALWDHIVKWFNVQTGPGRRRLYAKYCAIVQSSGMGKSRTVDELSKTQFVIPVNLRPKSSGYPPSDNSVRDYLSGSMRQEEAFIRSYAFLHALFLRTRDFVEKELEAEGTIAEQFRDKMQKDMSRERHGKFRVSFYDDIVHNAEKSLHETYITYFRDKDGTQDEKLLSSDFPLRGIFEKLYKKMSAVDPQRAKLRDPHFIPYVVLAFDEVHCLTGLVCEEDRKWSRFGELRRAIRGLLKEPLFTLFLSTSGAMFSVTATPARDISGRMITTCDVIPPFFDLGFDQLALPVDFSRRVLLSEIASLEHLASYGRPLWRHYLLDLKPYLIDTAVMKLLGGVPRTNKPLDPAQKLACLAERIPIEFLSTSFASQLSGQEKHQVHAHMRVILNIDDNLETIVTTSPSEPILSEAAYSVMTTEGFNPPQDLQEILNGFAVHKGELGELIVALLFTMARDKAVGLPATSGLPREEQRWCSVTELLQSLFCTGTRITAWGGSEFMLDGTKLFKAHLGTTFKGSSVYFTHFIKVHQHAVVELKFLMHLMVRGAAILCANGQPGIDGIIPFLLKGDEIKEGNIGVIMFQVKNDDHYQDSPNQALVLEMDPLCLRLTNPDIPIIRFFFALAANKPTLQRVKYENSYKSKNTYKAYDFWVSGLSSTIFEPVVNNEVAWGSLLKVSQGWEQIYSSASGHGRKLRKSMNPGAATTEEFWQNWCKEVPHY